MRSPGTPRDARVSAQRSSFIEDFTKVFTTKNTLADTAAGGASPATTTGSGGSTPSRPSKVATSGMPPTLARRMERRAEGLSLNYGRPSLPSTPATGSSGRVEGGAVGASSPLASKSTGVLGVEIPTGSLDLGGGAIPRPDEMAGWRGEGSGLGIALGNGQGGAEATRQSKGKFPASPLTPPAAAPPAAKPGYWNGKRVVYDTTTGELGIPSSKDPSALEEVLGKHPAFAQANEPADDVSELINHALDEWSDKGTGKASLPALKTTRASKIPRPVKAYSPLTSGSPVSASPSATAQAASHEEPAPTTSYNGPVTPINTTFPSPTATDAASTDDKGSSSMFKDYDVSPLDPRDPYLDSQRYLNRSPVSSLDPDEQIAASAIDLIDNINASTPSPRHTQFNIPYSRPAPSQTTIQSYQSTWSSDSDDSQPKTEEANREKTSKIKRSSFMDLSKKFKFGSAGKDRKRHTQKLETIDELNTSSTYLVSKPKTDISGSITQLEKPERAGNDDEEAVIKYLTSKAITLSRQLFSLPPLTVGPKDQESHPNHPFGWTAKKLHCAVHQHACVICGKMCCEEERLKNMFKYNMVGMESGGEEGVDKKLEKLWTLSKEGDGIERFDTFLHCVGCGRKVCTQCCKQVKDGRVQGIMCKLCKRHY
ncbi:Hypothetical protein D9617_12g035870 [Elsinoe fawcettii]|nr:Hypothetical protein D9617_12g035870 [Elsinoe fawcettii]